MKKWLMLLLGFVLAFQFSLFDALAQKTGPDLKIINSAGTESIETGHKEVLSASDDLLQFTSGGHILGFQPDRVYMAGMGYLLTEEFIGTKGTAPVSTGSFSQKDNFTKGAPELMRVSYPDLWQGITLIYEATRGGLAQTTYFIAPETDVNEIRLRYNAEAKIQPNGTLRFTHPTEKGYFTMTAPIAWQEMDGQKIPVAVAFNENPDNTIGFTVGTYDRHRPLIIDPTYQWHTFLGSASADRGHGITLDASGNVYVAGFSSATWGTPVNGHSGGGDIVVVKLNNAGELIWNTFHGSASDDSGYGIALDPAGNIYVSGYSTAAWGAPENAYSGNNEIVVLKLNTAGVLQWNTFHGSTGYDVIYFAGTIAVDTDGNSYVTGRSNVTWGTPVSPNSGGGDIVVFKLNSFGVLQWNTFHGSTSSDNGYGIALDTGGNVYVTGYSYVTWGTPVNGHGGDHDIVIFKLNGLTGNLVWNTFHGSGNYDEGYDIALDPDGNIYVTARSEATWGAPVSAYSGDSDIAVLKLNNSGMLQWNTFHGSASNDYGYHIAIDTEGNVYVTGLSYATWGSPVIPNNGHDLTVFKLNNSGVLQWNAFYGSIYGDSGNGIVAAGGDVYITGESNFTWGDPIDPFTRTEVNSLDEILVLKLADQAPPGQYTLTINKTGTGSGTVTSSPAGINCGGTCSADYAAGTVVTLMANPSPGSVFAGWSGDCSGTDLTVEVTMNAAKSCTARFNLAGSGTAIPTLSEWGMIIMSMMLAGSAIWIIRRRQIS